MNTVILDAEKPAKKSSTTLIVLVLVLVLLGGAGYGAWALYQSMMQVPMREIAAEELVTDTLSPTPSPGMAPGPEVASGMPGPIVTELPPGAAMLLRYGPFQDAATATRVAAKLTESGVSAVAQDTRVFAGPFATPDALDQARTTIRALLSPEHDVLSVGVIEPAPSQVASQSVDPGLITMVDSTPVPGVGASIAKPPVPGNMLSAKEIEFARMEEDLLREIRLMRMRVELSELNTKMLESKAPAPAQPTAPPGLNVIDAPKPDPLLLVSVWGREESALRADFFLKGYRRTVRAGDALIDGWVVERVTRTGVDVRRGTGSKMERRTVALGGAGQR